MTKPDLCTKICCQKQTMSKFGCPWHNLKFKQKRNPRVQILKEQEKYTRMLIKGFVKMLPKHLMVMKLKQRNFEFCFWNPGEILNLKMKTKNALNVSKNEGVSNKMRMLQVALMLEVGKNISITSFL